MYLASPKSSSFPVQSIIWMWTTLFPTLYPLRITNYILTSTELCFHKVWVLFAIVVLMLKSCQESDIRRLPCISVAAEVELSSSSSATFLVQLVLSAEIPLWIFSTNSDTEFKHKFDCHLSDQWYDSDPPLFKSLAWKSPIFLSFSKQIQLRYWRFRIANRNLFTTLIIETKFRLPYEQAFISCFVHELWPHSLFCFGPLQVLKLAWQMISNSLCFSTQSLPLH